MTIHGNGIWFYNYALDKVFEVKIVSIDQGKMHYIKDDFSIVMMDEDYIIYNINGQGNLKNWLTDNYYLELT